MGSKRNLEAVETMETEQSRWHEYTSEQISDMADHLYYVQAVLDVLSLVGEAQSDINGMSISIVALSAKERIQKTLEILQP